jgi:hypothetical protein
MDTVNRLGIMQPYFFPYLGYFSLIRHTDHWIVFDAVQYIRKGWINRNRVLRPLEPHGGWQYITVPVEKAHRDTKICEIKCVNDTDWRERLPRQLEHYRRVAPYYDDVLAFVETSIDAEFQFLGDLLVHLLQRTCEYIGIPFRYDVQSKMSLDLGPITHAGDWALEISRAVSARAYVNAPGGESLFDRKDWDAAGIQLHFLTNNLRPYDQRRTDFVPGLSIIDVMMFCDRPAILEMLDDVTWK